MKKIKKEFLSTNRFVESGVIGFDDEPLSREELVDVLGESSYEKIAIHEAGHAAVALLKGAEVVEMGIVENGGYTSYALANVEGSDRINIMDSIVISQGGYLAEMNTYDEETPVMAGSCSDIDRVMELLDSYHRFELNERSLKEALFYKRDSNEESYVEIFSKCEDECKNLLEEHSGLVDLLADALDKEVFLDKDKINKIVKRYRRRKGFWAKKPKKRITFKF